MMDDDDERVIWAIKLFKVYFSYKKNLFKYMNRREVGESSEISLQNLLISVLHADQRATDDVMQRCEWDQEEERRQKWRRSIEVEG